MPTPSRPIGPFRGPSISTYDELPAIEDDPDFKTWHGVVPYRWYARSHFHPEAADPSEPNEYSTQHSRSTTVSAPVQTTSVATRRASYVRSSTVSCGVKDAVTSPGAKGSPLVNRIVNPIGGEITYLYLDRNWDRTDSFNLIEASTLGSADRITSEAVSMQERSAVYTPDKVSSDHFRGYEGSTSTPSSGVTAMGVGDLLMATTGTSTAWTAIPTQPYTEGQPFVDVDYLAGSWVVITTRKVLRSTDDGVSWVDITSQLSGLSAVNFTACKVLDGRLVILDSLGNLWWTANPTSGIWGRIQATIRTERLSPLPHVWQDSFLATDVISTGTQWVTAVPYIYGDEASNIELVGLDTFYRAIPVSSSTVSWLKAGSDPVNANDHELMKAPNGTLTWDAVNSKLIASGAGKVASSSGASGLPSWTQATLPLAQDYVFCLSTSSLGRTLALGIKWVGGSWVITWLQSDNGTTWSVKPTSQSPPTDLTTFLSAWTPPYVRTTDLTVTPPSPTANDFPQLYWDNAEARFVWSSGNSIFYGYDNGTYWTKAATTDVVPTAIGRRPSPTQGQVTTPDNVPPVEGVTFTESSSLQVNYDQTFGRVDAAVFTESSSVQKVISKVNGPEGGTLGESSSLVINTGAVAIPGVSYPSAQIYPGVGPGGTGSAFSPLTDIGWHTAFWASDPAQTPPTAGTAISAWRDGSGNNRTFNQTASTPTYTPNTPGLNSKPSLTFDNDSLATNVFTAIGGPFTIVTIGRNASTYSHNSNVASTGTAGIRVGSTPYRMGAWTGATVRDDTVDPLGQSVLSISVVNGASSKTIFNDRVTTSLLQETVTAGQLVLGSYSVAITDAWTGDLAFAAVYQGDLTQDARFQDFLGWVTEFYAVPTPAGAITDFNVFSDLNWSAVSWASDPLQTKPADGGAVASWRDGSGAGHTLVQATSNLQPSFENSDPTLNKKPSLIFNQDALLSDTINGMAQPYSVVGVMYIEATQLGLSSADILSTYPNSLAFDNGSATYKLRLYAGNQVVAGSTDLRGQAYSFVAVYNGATSKVVINDVATAVVGDVGAQAPTRLVLGAYDASVFSGSNVHIALAGVLPGDVTQHPNYNTLLGWIRGYYGINTGVTPLLGSGAGIGLGAGTGTGGGTGGTGGTGGGGGGPAPSGNTSANEAAGNPAGLTYGAPYIISSNGVYDGTVIGHHSKIAVGANVTCTITKMAIKGPGPLIDISSGADVTITYCYLEGTTGTGGSPRAIFAGGGCKRLVVENCKGSNIAGIKVINATTAQEIRIRYNKWVNVIGNANSDFVQFAQFDNVFTSNFEIAWNYVKNYPGQSWVEDNISFFKCGGPDNTHRWKVHHNCLWGGFPYDAFNATGYSGGGIMHNDFSTNTQGHIETYNNYVLGTTNYGISCVGGTDAYIHDNTVIGSGRAENGQAITSSQGGGPNGMVLWFPSWQPAGVPTNNVFLNNKVGWWRSVAANRNDYWWDSTGQPAASGNNMSGTTLYKSGLQLTWADEKLFYDEWEASRAVAGFALGPNW